MNTNTYFLLSALFVLGMLSIAESCQYTLPTNGYTTTYTGVDCSSVPSGASYQPATSNSNSNSNWYYYTPNTYSNTYSNGYNNNGYTYNNGYNYNNGYSNGYNNNGYYYGTDGNLYYNSGYSSGYSNPSSTYYYYGKK
uniref:Prisilkin-39-like n=1 Tax=Rhabditophanes sp. KR3021 TaxID=114890 RepID=A0AC35TVQ7_9BILA